MDLESALALFGLEPSATEAVLTARYRAMRKPLLKRLNRAEPGSEPPQLVQQLDDVEAAYKAVRKAFAKRAAASPKPQEGSRRSTGRVTLETGAVLLGRYEIKQLVTHRPEGDTYRVYDRIRQGEVALKIVDEALLRAKGRRALLQRGLLDASRLNHPRLARTLDLHPLQHTFAVTQALPDGHTLWDLVHGSVEDGPELTPALVLRMAEQVTHGLAYAHTLMPHGTLRPESIWILSDGNAQVADLGLVDLQQPLRAKRLSRAKLGTAYWAPEQFRDDAEGVAASDQYALALMCYEAINGEPARGRIGRIRDEANAYPRRFKRALARALASRPQRRYADMDAFGAAAFPRYRRPGTKPAMVSRTARLAPALLLLAVFAGWMLSPLGSKARDALGGRARSWDEAMERDTAEALETRRLEALVARLSRQKERLDEASRAELERLQALFEAGRPDAATREAARRDLTQVVRQVVGTSRHRAEKAWRRTQEALAALEDARTALAREAGTRLDELGASVHSTPAVERDAAVALLLRTQARRDRGLSALDDRLDSLRRDPALATGLRALHAAERALRVGDDTSSGRAYDAAAEAFEPIAAQAALAVQTLGGWRPPAAAPLPLARLDDAGAAAVLDTHLHAAASLSDDRALETIFEILRKEAIDAGQVRWGVSPEGWFALTIETTARRSTLAGTWQEGLSGRTLRASYWDGRLLETPFAVPADREAAVPGLADLGAALARAPRSSRATWSVVRSGTRPLEAPEIDEAARVVRAGELRIAARLPEGPATGMFAAGRRHEPSEGRVEATARVPGDILRTWIRAHAVAGLRSSPAAWVAVRVDGIEPRLHLLEPRPDTTLEPGQEVVVRFFAYDSNLAGLEVQGAAEPLRRDDVYVLVERTLRAPETGGLELPVRAVDDAGNEARVTWTWAVR